MTPDRESLEAELLALFAGGVEQGLSKAEFDRLALSVFAYQFERCAPYAAFCRRRGRTPETVTCWSDVPAVPTAAFKAAELTTFPPDRARVLYLTSGTTGSLAQRGRHLLPDNRLYDASLLPNFRAHLLPGCERMRMLVFGPSAACFPNSSLGHMHSVVLTAFGAEGSRLYWNADGPDFDGLAAALEQSEGEGVPVCLLGTAFGFVHFLDWMDQGGRCFRLPPGSRVMDTGGYKGRSREVPKRELYALYESRWSVPIEYVVNEYGMTEMGSQFYDRVLRDHVAGRNPHSAVDQRAKTPPPWVRSQVVDPESLEPLPEGEVGLLRHFDLANLHTVAHIQTDDLGIRRGDGFEVLGRAAGAEPRGCSLAAEELG